MRRASVLLLVIGFVTLAMIPGALAQKPDNYSWVFEGEFYFGSCDGFDIIEDVTIEVRVREYYDNQGIPIRSRWWHDLSGSRFYNSADPSKWLPEVGHSISFDDYAAGTATSVGLISRVMVPGEGHVLIDVGRIIEIPATWEVLFEAGPHEWFYGEIDDLCEALS